MAADVPGLDRVLSEYGWPLASSPPVEPGDPGRFAALFGRDALITSLQLMPVRPDVATATLRALAGTQGVRDDAATDEEPGKIVHEDRPHAPARFAEAGWPVRDGRLRYYGSADGTCWFLVVLAALDDAALERELERSWRAAGGWLLRALERGGGLVRHGPRAAPGGLAQQGWRDSTDPLQAQGGGILRTDGSVPRFPLADVDTQAVAVAALRALARLSGERDHLAAAVDLAALVEERLGPETMALEGDGREVTGPGSQLGWLLWADALSPARAEVFAERLSRPDVASPWGLRTLSREHPQFKPGAYHRGAVWPFDSWLGWAGLRAVGAHEAAERVRAGVIGAIERLGLWPELFAAAPSGPEPIPIANRVQAWTVGAAWALANEWDGRVTGPPAGVQTTRGGGNGEHRA